MASEQDDVVPYRSSSSDIPTGDISAGDASGASAVEPADESQADLLGSRYHYRRVVQALSEGVFVQDRLGKMLTVNTAAAKILGLDLKHLAGMNTSGLAWDIVDEHGVAVAVDDRPGRRCITSGKPTVGEVFGMRLPDGGLKWIEIDALPLVRRGDAGPYAVVSTVRDVTDKLSAQRAAATAEHRHRVVLANAVEGYHIVDPHGVVLEANPPTTAASVLVDGDGRMTFALLDETDHQIMNDVLAKALAQPGETFHADVRVRAVPDEDCWLEFSVTNHLDDPAVGGIVINHRDVTVRHAAEDSIRFQADLLDAAGQAIVGTDRRGRILFWNKVATRMYGWTRDEVIGRFVQQIVPPIDSAAQMAELTTCIARGDTWTGDLWIRCKDRTVLQVFMTTTPVYDAAGAFLAIVGVSTDITERKLAESELARLALHDPLTDLPNRLLLVNRLDEHLQRRELHGDAVVVLFIDLDRFKVINDGIGHQTGDEVLRAAAHRLAAEFPDEFIARFGGDEFVLLHCEPNRIDTDALGRRGFTPCSNGRSPSMVMSCSSRRASASPTPRTATPAKRSSETPTPRCTRRRTAAGRGRRCSTRRCASGPHGDSRGRTRCATPSTGQSSGSSTNRSSRWPTALPSASRRSCGGTTRRSAVSAQPTSSRSPRTQAPSSRSVHGSSSRLSGSSRHGTESSGTDDLWMTVNVSTRQLATPSLVDTIRAALSESGIVPARLHLEITETALILDDDRSIKTLQALRDMGVRLAIDDFGTGYSSLTYLKQLPIDVLKIDRSFVDGLGTDPNDTSIVRMILSLASALDLTAIAEGVETEVQLAALREYGCELGQGYLWTPGLPPEELVAWLDRTWAFARSR